MSEGIELSDQLVDEILQAITKQEPKADGDFGICLQYMAAVMGVIAAEFPGSQSQREEFLKELSAFTQHVAKQHTTSLEQKKENPAKGRCEPDPDNPGAGVWRPDKS